MDQSSGPLATSNRNPNMLSKINVAPADSAAAVHDHLWSHLGDFVRGLVSPRGPLSLEDPGSRDWRATILRWTQMADVQIAHPREALLGLRVAITDMEREEADILVAGLAVSGTLDDSPEDPAPSVGTKTTSRKSA